MTRKKINTAMVMGVPIQGAKSDLDFKLQRLIFISLGEASMCWDSPQSAGEFHSTEATKIGLKLVEDIKNLVRNI